MSRLIDVLGSACGSWARVRIKSFDSYQKLRGNLKAEISQPLRSDYLGQSLNIGNDSNLHHSILRYHDKLRLIASENDL